MHMNNTYENCHDPVALSTHFQKHIEDIVYYINIVLDSFSSGSGHKNAMFAVNHARGSHRLRQLALKRLYLTSKKIAFVSLTFFSLSWCNVVVRYDNVWMFGGRSSDPPASVPTHPPRH